jgi:hypothetical protein
MAATTISRTSFTDSVSAVTGDIWNAALIGTSIYDKVDGLLTASLRIEKSTGGAGMSFTVAHASNTAASDAILQAVVAGTSGGDAQLVLVITSGSTWSVGVDNSDSDMLKITNSATTSANTFVIDTAGNVYLGDNSNANMTVGLTINQGANDNQLLAFKSSDVTHGMTTFTETDTYGDVLKASSANGGAQIRGWSAGTTGLSLFAAHTTDDTTKTGTSAGAFVVYGALKSATSITALGVNANIVAFQNNGTTRFILDGDGDSHQDVGTAWTNFDDFDDVALLTALSGAVSRQDDPLRQGFSAWVQRYRETLERHRIVTINDRPGGDGSVFINWSRTQMVLIGAIRQLASKIQALEA